MGVDGNVNSVDFHNGGSDSIVSATQPIAIEGPLHPVVGKSANNLLTATTIANIARLKEVVTQSTHLA